jgi:ribonuclease P protein component
VLARANRVTRPDDFRVAVRRGRRVSTPNAMLHIVDRATQNPSRFGFIVAKSVGGAVTRNFVRRRLRAVCRDILPTVPFGTDVVIRALPGCEGVDWATLHTEIATGIDRGLKRG